MPQSLSPIKQIAVLSFSRAGRLTGLNYDGGVRERHVTSSLHFSWIHFTIVDLNLTQKRHKKNCRQLTDITGMRDRELTDDSLRDREEKVAENVKHADGYRCTLEGKSDQKSIRLVIFLLLESKLIH